MAKTKELRTLQSDAARLRTTLDGKMEELKNLQKEFLQRRDALGPASSEADRRFFSDLQEQGRSQKKDVEDDHRKYKAIWETWQLTREHQDEMAHELADRCGADLPGIVNIARGCNKTDVLRCTGDADWDGLDSMWHAADPLEQQVDEYLLNNLPDPAVFQKLKNEEAHTRERRHAYVERSGLSAQEQQDLSRLCEEYQQIRQSLERIRTDYFGNDIAYQKLLLLREVLTICENAAVRWWSDYDVELEEWTGYPIQRDLPSVEDMTETQFRDEVAWVQAHPLYKYDGSLKGSVNMAMR
ncbi:hypothetical protein LTR96_011084 [Exophiala xenobiotica]|nr:hypothetical protein LTR96_011084 [Exophiala xenobiotica]KAK5284697.1 hypothetical protein LTR14_011566 [Exophiala xenobiotica]KAK5466303.1 hypothetical protein LTR55_011580 [Exophiala xenobiotica]